MNLTVPALGATLLLLGACQPFSELNGTEVSMSGAGVLVDQPLRAYGPAELAQLIYSTTPGWTSDHKPELVTSSYPVGTPQFMIPHNPDLDKAIGWFGRHLHEDWGAAGNVPAAARQTRMRDARNEIQGVLFAASTNRCNKYKLMLRERSSNVSFILGSVATGLGAAGAIFTNATSQILAGMAGATSGINAEYNKNIMSNLASSVIVPGIDKQRAAIAQEVANRRCLGLPSYTLSQALADALRFHAACSTDVGVAAAGAALSQSHHVTLADAKATIDAVRALSAALRPPEPKGGSTGSTAGSSASSGGTASNTAGTTKPADPSKDNGQTGRTTLLLGDPINLLQCPPLDRDGLLGPNASPAEGVNPGSPGQVPFGVLKTSG